MDINESSTIHVCQLIVENLVRVRWKFNDGTDAVMMFLYVALSFLDFLTT